MLHASIMLKSIILKDYMQLGPKGLTLFFVFFSFRQFEQASKMITRHTVQEINKIIRLCNMFTMSDYMIKDL